MCVNVLECSFMYVSVRVTVSMPVRVSVRMYVCGPEVFHIYECMLDKAHMYACTSKTACVRVCACVCMCVSVPESFYVYRDCMGM